MPLNTLGCAPVTSTTEGMKEKLGRPNIMSFFRVKKF
jgi:hypothetical protein